ncbi:MAG: twin-arginine translocase subunit TatC [Desulfocapsaceae bacterium]|nr:twin-arginine translocase subunit TatC [Desulfocapsaceae bacterium]
MELQNKAVIFIGELRKSLRALGIGVFAVTIVIFFLTPDLLRVVQHHLAEKLYFFSVAGPFLAHVKLAAFSAIYGLVPWLMAVFWRAIGKPFGVEGAPLFFFILFTTLLFYAGTLFCYFVTLPYGINFLLGFGSEQLRPVISISRFVNFVTLFLLGFGAIFELPVFMVFLAKVGLCPRSFFEKNRRYALLLIAIVAALLTPTPDIVNMLLMGGPLYLLYESGILILLLMRIK